MQKIQVTALLLSFGILTTCLEIVPHPHEQALKSNLNSLLENIDAIPKKTLTAEVDEYIDLLLANFNDFVLQQSLDPSSVPDVDHKFKWSIAILPIYGEISLKNGNFTGISTVYRRQQATVSYDNETISIRIPLGFKKLMIDYDYSATLLGLGPSGGVKGVINTFKLTMNMDINLHHLIFDLTQFSVDGSGLIYTEFSGFIITDLVLEILTNVVVNLFRGIILNKIEDSIHKPLAKLVDDLNNGISKVLRP